jgi:Tol biopolymer transport system component
MLLRTGDYNYLVKERSQMDNATDLLHNRYKIISQLGEGGMGAVYLALDTALENQVAIKLNRSRNPQATSQFMSEARLLASLRHPHLPRVIDYFMVGQDEYLVMDYIPGEDLKALLEKKGPQPLDVVIRWANQLGSALTYLHNQNPPVIHRDIKPANLKLTADGEIVLVDFGIAKASEISQHTATGAFGFTPGYAPPEQYGGGRSGPYTDQFAMAATIYHLLTSQQPTDSVQRMMGQAVLTPMHLLNRTIPLNVQGAIEKAMSVRPEDRFQSVAAFVAALNDPAYRFTAANTLQSQPASAAADNPTMVRSTVQSVVGKLGQTAENTAQKPASKTGLWLALGGGVVILILLALAGGGALAFTILNKASPTVLAPSPAATFTQMAVIQPTTPVPLEKPTDTLQVVQATTAVPVVVETETPAPPAATTPAPTTPAPTLQTLGGGGTVAFVSDRADGKTMQVWRMKVVQDPQTNQFSGTVLEQLTFTDTDKANPVWSPDGTKLLFTAPGGKLANGSELGLDIWLLDLGRPGSEPVDLTRRPGDDTDSAWAPGGKQIAFANDGRQDKVKMIYVMNDDGSGQKVVSYDQFEYSPRWTPKGDQLLFITKIHERLFFKLRDPLKTEKTATPMPYDKQQVFGRFGDVADPVFSPDGVYLAFTQIRNNQRKIYVAEFAGRGDNPRLMSQEPFRDSHPSWSPDGKWLVFASDRDHNPEIYIMTSAGLLQYNLTNSPGRELDPAWQP